MGRLPVTTRHLRAPLAALLAIPLLAALALGLAACGTQTVTIATVLPASGPDAPLGLAMQRAVDLAVSQNATPGYQLSVTHLDEASASLVGDLSALAANTSMVGMVGPYGSAAALAVLPVTAASGIATISPGATLPGLTLADAAQAEQVPFATLHPKGRPLAFFRLPPNDTAAGKAAADVAVAPVGAHGYGVGSVFVVDDGSASGLATAAAFVQELAGKGATLAGKATINLAQPDSAQTAVTAIIEANPDLVFYGGGTATGVALRSTLSLTGAPGVPILTAGPIAGDPGWAAAVGDTPAAANTAALLPALDLSVLTSKSARAFIAAYQNAYPGQALLPQSALAYDAAMDEITAIRQLIHANKPVTRTAVHTAVSSGKYAGVTGTLAFDANGDDTAPSPFSFYTCDIKGGWHFVGAVGGSAT
ncbi:MAG TPA: branched-chain amino acid ABC transporter substrate-binding protein [Ktedonobacterales bacterium]|jgi:ABC-type branched-subunit amino acid transport system substrate-binding protein